MTGKFAQFMTHTSISPESATSAGEIIALKKIRLEAEDEVGEHHYP